MRKQLILTGIALMAISGLAPGGDGTSPPAAGPHRCCARGPLALPPTGAESLLGTEESATPNAADPAEEWSSADWACRPPSCFWLRAST